MRGPSLRRRHRQGAIAAWLAVSACKVSATRWTAGTVGFKAVVVALLESRIAGMFDLAACLQCRIWLMVAAIIPHPVFILGKSIDILMHAAYTELVCRSARTLSIRRIVPALLLPQRSPALCPGEKARARRGLSRGQRFSFATRNTDFETNSPITHIE